VSVVAWCVTTFDAVLLVAFSAYLYSLRRLPTAERTEVPVFDRFGRRRKSRHPSEPRRK
jgi:hypothetical protein